LNIKDRKGGISVSRSHRIMQFSPPSQCKEWICTCYYSV